MDMSGGSRLDPYLERYAARTHGMTTSEIRALFAVANRPEIIGMGGGSPCVSALPLDVIGEMTARVITEQGAQALQYMGGQGDPRLRELICGVMALEGISASADDVIVTVGSQQALDVVSRIFLDPGDVVIAEAPSYVGALGTFTQYQADVVHVTMDDAGLVPEALRAAIADVARSGRRAKFVYTVPNYHNPAGITLIEERRDEIIAICAEAGLLILEDNPYGLLGFDGPPLPALRSRVTDGIIYLGSFSKTFAAGVRVGWVLAPPGVKEKLIMASEATTLCPVALSQYVVAEFLDPSPLARPDQGLPRALPRPARCLPRGTRSVVSGGLVVDQPDRRFLRLGHAARWHRCEGDAAARDPGPGRLRAGRRLLLRRPGHPKPSAGLQPARARPDPRGRPAAGRRPV